MRTTLPSGLMSLSSTFFLVLAGLSSVYGDDDDCPCNMYTSGNANVVCTSTPERAADKFGFEYTVYVPRPASPGGWGSVWQCTSANRSACLAANEEPFLQLKVNWPHKQDHPDVSWADSAGAKAGKPVNRPSYHMGTGPVRKHFSGGIEGRSTEYSCNSGSGGHAILYSSPEQARRTDASAANGSAVWWMCGELNPSRALQACSSVPACKYVARHESGDAVFVDPVLDGSFCVDRSQAQQPACSDPKLPMIWFFFDDCVDCDGREWITPADGWIGCEGPPGKCGGTNCTDADGTGNMLLSGAEYWMWSGSPTWRRKGG